MRSPHEKFAWVLSEKNEQPGARCKTAVSEKLMYFISCVGCIFFSLSGYLFLTSSDRWTEKKKKKGGNKYGSALRHFQKVIILLSLMAWIFLSHLNRGVSKLLYLVVISFVLYCLYIGFLLLFLQCIIYVGVHSLYSVKVHLFHTFLASPCGYGEAIGL